MTIIIQISVLYSMTENYPTKIFTLMNRIKLYANYVVIDDHFYQVSNQTSLFLNTIPC